MIRPANAAHDVSEPDDSAGEAAEPAVMRLRIFLPTEVAVDARVTRVVAEAENGSFCLLPRHTDFVTALCTGILTYTTLDGTQFFAAVTPGLLVKQYRSVSVSTRHAVSGSDPTDLRHLIRERFEQIDEKERQAVSAAARMEADFVRRFMKLEDRSNVTF